MKKEGWYVVPGSLPIEKQLKQTYKLQTETDENGELKYIVVEANSLAESELETRLVAIEMAKLQLVNQLSARITARIETHFSNNEINSDEVTSVQHMTMLARNATVTNISNTLIPLEIYRKVEGTNQYECEVRLAYRYELAKQAASTALKSQLKGDTTVSDTEIDGMFRK